MGSIDRLSGTELLVAFCGFTPGFAYMTGLPEELAVPRLETPRPRVPGRISRAGRLVRGHLPHAIARRLAARGLDRRPRCSIPTVIPRRC